jgi:hypothetical protein
LVACDVEISDERGVYVCDLLVDGGELLGDGDLGGGKIGKGVGIEGICMGRLLSKEVEMIGREEEG